MRSERRRSIDVDGHLHELTFSTYRRVKALEIPHCAYIFLQSLARAREALAFELYAYVVMPEHIHLLLRPKDGGKISGVLKYVKQSSSKRILAHLNEIRPTYMQRFMVVGPDGSSANRFWQSGGGYDRNLISEKAIVASLNYIHANPVTRGLCEFVSDWPYSSARAYMDGLGDPPLDVDQLVL